MNHSVTQDNAHEPVVAFCIEELSVGGAEHMLVVLANEFVMRGWQVHMVCLSKSGELASRLNESVQLHVLNKKPGIDLALPLRIRQCMDEIKPDVINSHLWVSNAWIRLSLLKRRIPVVVTEHSRDTWKPAYYRWIDKWLAARTYRMVAVSGDTADFYAHDVGIDKGLITVINNGIDTALFASGCGEELRHEWLQSTGIQAKPERSSILIGTVGRLVSAKNHLRLIEACADVINDHDLCEQVDIRLIIVGDGPERSSLEQRIDDLGMCQHITLAGTRHDIPDVLAAFDVFVLSSDREGHPLTALEAQAAGTPVILTDAGGSSDAIAGAGDPAGGILVQKSVEALSDALRHMIINAQLRQKRARFAQEFAMKHFDKRQMVERYENLFRAALAEP